MKDILSLHKRIESLYPMLVMEGHYVTVDVLEKLPSEIEPVPVYYGSVLIRSLMKKSTWYALSCTPPMYTRIIKEALRVRRGTGHRDYFSVVKRRRDAICYIDYMIQECNRVFKEGL